MRDNEELRVRVRRIGAERYLILANGTAQGARANRIGPAAELRARFDRLLEIESGNAPSGSTNTLEGMRVLGRSVFDALIGDELAACVVGARAEADRHGRGLRLRFDLPSDLHALPVETMRAPPEHSLQTFGPDGNLSIVRSLPGGPFGHRLPTGDCVPEKLNLLIAVATPAEDGLPRIDATAELAELREVPVIALRVETMYNATLAKIEDWLSRAAQPTAVLLIAHGRGAADGNDGMVLLEAEDGTADAVPGDVLSGMFIRAPHLRLVVLNLCFSARNSEREPFAGLAQAMIGRGIPAVVAMHGLVTDRAASAFGPKLLARVCENKPVDEAVTLARHHLNPVPGHTAIEWATPMLFLNEACAHGWLFKVREVRDDDESADPLKAGEDALRQVNDASGNVKPATALAAARFLRLRREWDQVESIAKATRPTTEESAGLIAEAELEQAWPEVERLCEALAEADHVRAQERLDGDLPDGRRVRDMLPEPVLSLLRMEIAAARTVSEKVEQARRAAADGHWVSAVDRYERLDGEQPPGVVDVTAALATAREEVALAEHYANLCAYHEAGQWEAALTEGEKILAVRPGGYRDTAARAGYLAGRSAEAEARWADAVRAYERCGGFADAPAREAYARGNVTADEGDWAAAEGHLRAAAELGIADHLTGYAAGRVAEDADDWVAARRQYAGLPEDVRDTGARKRYADGRIADDRADWTGVIDRFGGLPDCFAGGEVGRRRQYARAKLREGRTDWRAVLTLLGALRDDDRGGSVGMLRWTARGRLAEADDDWARAAECYALAGDLGSAHRYATGRKQELDGDWAGAIDTYAALPDDHRDASWRIVHARARMAELDLDWPRAAELYGRLPGEFSDAPVRASYARLRMLLANREWALAVQESKRCGGYLDAPILAAYARGRRAEQRGSWAEAAAQYRSCGDHADAAGRAAYTHGRHLDVTGHWSAAVAAYEQATGIDAVVGADIRRRTERLRRLLAEVPFLEGLADATLAADPVALRESTFPYLALREAGITPASPTEVVADAAFTLMESGDISWRERVAWDQLRTPAKRLLLETRMYPLREPAALRRALAGLDPADEEHTLDRLCERLPADGPLLTLLAGDQAQAVRLWRDRLATRLDDQDDAHCLGVASFWHAQGLEETGAWEQAAEEWRTALACLAMTLANDGFWIGWRQGRASCYRHTVTPADSQLVRVELGRYLIGVLNAHAERHADAGRRPEAGRYRELVSFFEAELKAAQCLKEAGGLPLRGGEGRLSCGREYLRMFGLARTFGEFVAAEDQPGLADADPRQGLLRRLRCAFSNLSAAANCLDHHRFESALRALPDYHRKRRRELPDDCGGPARHGDVDGCAHCREFVENDPAYMYLPNRRVRLLGDAAELAVRARLSIARDLLAGHRPDPALAELAEAIKVAANALMGVRAQDAVIRVLVGRVDALAETGEQGSAGLDEAIELVERAGAALGAPINWRLRPKLADLLVARAIWHGATCQQFGLPVDLARAVRDLRRALELGPDSPWTRSHLAWALIRDSGERPVRNSADRLGPLIEALHVIFAGFDLAGISDHLVEVLNVTLDETDDILLARLPSIDLHRRIQELPADPAADLTGTAKARAHAREAERLRRPGDLAGRAYHLVEAVRAEPRDERYRTGLLAALAELRDEGSGT
ncbi:hypothetical protein GCM10022254_32480 [Actinomadura meridiana]|uniref:CHAT domain-containing protein n=1 Tax=Actinomadura meridiana TaxID=559626 RepID=A0ABP8C2J0_9ACTN